MKLILSFAALLTALTTLSIQTFSPLGYDALVVGPAQPEPEPLPFLFSDEIYALPATEAEVEAFLSAQPGPLKHYVEQNEAYLVPAARMITFYGERYGINPRLLLLMLEARSHLLSDPTAVVEGGSLAKELSSMAEELNLGFRDRYEGYNRLQVVLADGLAGEFSPSSHAATFALQRYVALFATREIWLDWVGDTPNNLRAQYETYFGALEDNLAPAEPAALPTLQLPWAVGSTWYYTGGPHDSTTGGVTYDKTAVDWAPGGGTGCTFTTNERVTASAAGTVGYAACNLVRIDHSSGSSTTYFHLSNILVSVGQSVSIGTPLGTPSCEYGASCGWAGSATGRHVHFDTRLNNIPQQIDGLVVGGWTIHNGAADYLGTMTKGGVTKVASSAKTTANAITNEGSGGCCGCVLSNQVQNDRAAGSLFSHLFQIGPLPPDSLETAVAASADLETAGEQAYDLEPEQEVAFYYEPETVPPPTSERPVARTAVFNLEPPGSTNYTVSCNVSGMGGGRQSSGRYTVFSTIGQPHETTPMMGGHYQVHPGFETACADAPIEPITLKVYLPTILRP